MNPDEHGFFNVASLVPRFDYFARDWEFAQESHVE